MEFDYQASTLNVGERIELDGKPYCVVAYTDMGDYLKLFCMAINSNKTRSANMNIPQYIGTRLYEDIREQRAKREGPPTVHKTAFEIAAEMKEKYKDINITTKKSSNDELAKGKRSTTSTTKGRKSKDE
jgi:hypothetical protein